MIISRYFTIIFIIPLSGWWFQTFFGIFHFIWDVILLIDELICFKMVIAPPTSDYCITIIHIPLFNNSDSNHMVVTIPLLTMIITIY